MEHQSVHSSRLTRWVRSLLVIAVVTLGVAACSSEEAEPVDLYATVTTATTEAGGNPHGMIDPVGPEGDDVNAETRQMVVDHATAQCLEDPDLAEGIVRMVDPETNEVANELRLNCAEVRAEHGADS